MQLVLLAGELGERYGTKHEYYNLQTPADAVKLLCINYPALKQELIEAHHNGIGYKVIQGGAAMGYEELQLPFGSKPLLVVPVISGSGGGPTTQILIGVGLVAASFLLPGAGLFGTTSLFGVSASGSSILGGAFAGSITGLVGGSALGTAIGTGLSAIGASLILSGTASLISPQPQLPNLSGNRIKGDGTSVRGTGPDGVTRGNSGVQSYAFTGPANTAGTGATLPVIYGQVVTGSHLVAVNLDVSDESDPLQTATQAASRKTLKVNGEEMTRELESLGGLDTKRGVIKVNTTDEDKKIKINNATFGVNKTLEAGSSISNDSLEYKSSSDKRKKVDVLFKVDNGIYDYVGAVGTTKIDGFITYEIQAEVTLSGEDVVVASARATIQGLVNESQNFSYGHRIEIPKVKKGKKVRIRVEIIDAEVHSGATLQVTAYGYKLLDEN
jgi:predicted phage tail protein|tara:strand:+ start:491 stop:1816 length:1326 start_codon:yes stop_codon:yes gene_type:complete